MNDQSTLAYQQGFQAGYLAAFHASLQILPEPMRAALQAAAAPPAQALQIQVAESADVSTGLEVDIFNLPEEVKEGEEGEGEDPEGNEEMKEEDEEDEEDDEETESDTPPPASKRRCPPRPGHY